MRQYTRAYEEQLEGFRLERERLEEAGYRNDVKVIVAGMVASGENANHIAGLLGIDGDIVIGWYRDIFLNQQDLAFDVGEFTFIREMNKLRADARTKGCIVKAVLEETLTLEVAAEAVGVSLQSIQNWINSYRRDYELMTTFPAGTDYQIKTPYAYTKEDADQLQALIFQHDREENELSSQLKEATR